MSTIEAGDVVERLEYADPPGMERRAFLRRSALAGAGAAALGSMLAACGANGGDSDGGQGAGNFPKTRKFRFVFVCHVTTNPFFVPTQYGIEDACALIGASSQWTGSKTAKVGEMLDAFNTALTSKADGIAIPIVDPKAFNAPVEKALSQGIPAYRLRRTSGSATSARTCSSPACRWATASCRSCRAATSPSSSRPQGR